MPGPELQVAGSSARRVRQEELGVSGFACGETVTAARVDRVATFPSLAFAHDSDPDRAVAAGSLATLVGESGLGYVVAD